MSAAVSASKPTIARTVLSWVPMDEFLALDVRSLALFRIILGLLLLVEWLNRLGDVRAHYSDEGILPRAAIGSIEVPFSIFLLNGSTWYAATLLGLGCVLAVILMLGWRTRFITFLCWFLLIGVHGRNFMMMQGGDLVMRLLLFWSLFLPLGACYSLDAWRNPAPKDRDNRVLSFGSAAFILQLVMVYLFAAAWKSAPEWRQDFTAVFLALSLDEFATPLGHWLLNFPALLRGLSLATMILEIFGPVLLFLPFANAQLRVFTITSFCLFHIGLGSCLELGNFPWICCAGWIALLPAWFWERLAARLRSPRRAKLTIRYDGRDVNQSRFVDALHRFLLLGEAKVEPRSSGPALTPRVVDSRGHEHEEDAALLTLVQASPLYWPLSYPLRWPAPRRALYHGLQWLTRRRSATATTATELQRHPEAELGGWLQNTLVFFCLLYVFCWNLRTLDISAHKTTFRTYFPEPLGHLGQAIGIDQSWGLFAPGPGRRDGWYIMPALLENGKFVDVYRDGAPVTSQKPALVSATYANSRWRSILMNLSYPEYAQLRTYYARWLYGEWNRAHGPEEQIVQLQIIWMGKLTQPDKYVASATEVRLFYYPEYPVSALGSIFGLTTRPVLTDLANRPLLPDLEGGITTP